MLSLVRAQPHSAFSAEAARLLAQVRALVAAQGVHSDCFRGRELWRAGWSPDARHKKMLVGGVTEFVKCAWCERHREWKRELDVEHYRPKTEVTRWEGSPPEVAD